MYLNRKIDNFLKNWKKDKDKKPLIIKEQSWWHIRKYYKSGHAALVVGESGPSENDDYGFLNITKNPPAGYSYLETQFPINNGSKKSHIRLYIQRDKKKYLSKWLMNYELSLEDYRAIQDFLDKQKKR